MQSFPAVSSVSTFLSRYAALAFRFAQADTER